MDEWQVDLEIDAAVAREFGETEAAVSIDAGRKVVAEENITTMDFPKFRSAMLRRGFSDAEVQATWAELRDRNEIPGASRDDHPKAVGVSELDFDEVLVLRDESQPSQLAAAALADPLVAGELRSALLDSQEAKAVVDALDEAPDTPFYAVRSGGTWEVRPLEEAAETYL